MNKTIKRTIYLLLFLITLSSCVSNKDIAYMQFDEVNQSEVSNVYQTVFKPDDLLLIVVTAEDVIASEPFNMIALIAGGIPGPVPYLIDSRGEIDFPILGKLKVGGLTREELISMLTNKLSPKYLKKFSIFIQITNFKITVQGDVRNPGTFTIPNERISIWDAIGLAGDLNLSGKRDNVMVLREEGNEKKQYRLDLRSNKILTSPVFYLQQNDVVYVEHNRAKIQVAQANPSISLIISVTTFLIGIFTLLSR